MSFWKSWETVHKAKNHRVLIRFENDHIEDAEIREAGDYDGGFYYVLYDGESLTLKPVAWAWIPAETNFVSMP